VPEKARLPSALEKRRSVIFYSVCRRTRHPRHGNSGSPITWHWLTALTTLSSCHLLWPGARLDDRRLALRPHAAGRGCLLSLRPGSGFRRGSLRRLLRLGSGIRFGRGSLLVSAAPGCEQRLPPRRAAVPVGCRPRGKKRNHDVPGFTIKVAAEKIKKLGGEVMSPLDAGVVKFRAPDGTIAELVQKDRYENLKKYYGVA
jgi:hypothetical protein